MSGRGSEFSIDLSFIKDEEVRSLAEDYYRQALLAYEAGAYLGTIVICGGVLEGILAWVLITWREMIEERYPGKPIEEWDLPMLIKVVARSHFFGIYGEPAAWAVKEFRNFIHPYNLLRKGTSARANQALAMGALGAVMEITRSLRSHEYKWQREPRSDQGPISIDSRRSRRKPESA